jgi:hypothetical protein
MVRSTGVVVVLCALALAGWSGVSSAVSHSRKPNLVDSLCTKPGQVKPSKIILACGDGNTVAQKLHWQKWGTGTAQAKGTLHQNDCTPYCAEGKFHDYPAHFALSDTVHADGRTYYTEVTVTFIGKRPRSFAKRSFSTPDCFVNPPETFLPRCPPMSTKTT